VAGGQKNNRACGSRFELECKKDALAKGLECRKHAMSGSLDEKGDITITTGFGEDWVGECKWRKELPAWFVNCLADHKFAVFKEARGEKIAILRWSDLLDLLQ
jgi:hypothetical protein